MRDEVAVDKNYEQWWAKVPVKEWTGDESGVGWAVRMYGPDWESKFIWGKVLHRSKEEDKNGCWVVSLEAHTTPTGQSVDVELATMHFSKIATYAANRCSCTSKSECKSCVCKKRGVECSSHCTCDMAKCTRQPKEEQEQVCCLNLSKGCAGELTATHPCLQEGCTKRLCEKCSAHINLVATQVRCCEHALRPESWSSASAEQLKNVCVTRGITLEEGDQNQTAEKMVAALTPAWNAIVKASESAEEDGAGDPETPSMTTEEKEEAKKTASKTVLARKALTLRDTVMALSDMPVCKGADEAALSFQIPLGLKTWNDSTRVLENHEDALNKLSDVPRDQLLEKLRTVASTVYLEAVAEVKLDIDPMGEWKDIMPFGASFLAYQIICNGLQGRFWTYSSSQAVNMVKDHWAWVRAEFKVLKSSTSLPSGWKPTAHVYTVLARVLSVLLFWQRANLPLGEVKPAPNTSKRAVEHALDNMGALIMPLFANTLAGDEHAGLRAKFHHSLSATKQAVSDIKVPARTVDAARKQAEFAILDMVELQSEMESALQGLPKEGVPTAVQHQLDSITRLLSRSLSTGNEALAETDVYALKNLRVGADYKRMDKKMEGVFSLRKMYEKMVEGIRCSPVSGKDRLCLFRCLNQILCCVMEKPLDLAEGKAEEKKIKNLRSNLAVAAPEFSKSLGELCMNMLDEESLKTMVAELQAEITEPGVMGGADAALVASMKMGVGITIHDVRASIPMNDSPTTHVGPLGGKQAHLVFSGGHYDIITTSDKVAGTPNCLFEAGDEPKVLSLVRALHAWLSEWTTLSHKPVWRCGGSRRQN